MALLLFSCSVPSNSLQPHGLQHARLPCPPLCRRVCSNSCPLSQWCHPNPLILCRPLLLLPPIFPSIRVFSNESVLGIKWPKYCSFSFSISPSNDYSAFVAFSIDLVWSPCCPRDSQESPSAPHFESISQYEKAKINGLTNAEECHLIIKKGMFRC